LNPNAPLFIPAAVRQVEDFSPEWWELVTTSTWFHDYWLRQNQGQDGFYGNGEDDVDGNSVADLLPDSIDFGDDDFSSIEAQFEEFIQPFEAGEASKFSFSAVKAMPENGMKIDAEGLMKTLSLSKSGKERSPKPLIEPAKHWEKAAKCMSPKCSPRRIQQPR